ncbi:MAG: hypothetical protein VB018_03410 [Lachnospiraceae bacterium]|nr:hypothetical protein [Lachnospiraceae bacterium]
MGNLQWLLIIGSFGGGVIGAYLGALPVFIMTGVVAIAGSIAAMAGGADLSVGYVAFGAYLGPQVGFGAGVVAAAYAGSRKKLASGKDILSPLFGLGDPMTLVVGGVTGVIGMVLFQIFAALGAPTDLPALAITIIFVVARLIFGTTGVLGKYDGEGKRTYITGGKGLACNILLGLGVGTAIGFVVAEMMAAGVSETALSSFPVLCFGISAVTLIFTQTGFACPATHHIAYPAACAAVWSGNPIMGVVFGILGALIGDFMVNTVNSYCDTHIDPPAATILILIFAATLLFL